MTDVPILEPIKPYAVYATVSVPLFVETSATSDQAAWDIVAAPGNRATIAKRLTEVSIEHLVAFMELQGFVQEITETSRPGQPNTAGNRFQSAPVALGQDDQ